MAAELDLDDVANTSPKARQELLDLRELVAFLQSPEVCAAAHEDVSDCGYCQRDRLRAGLTRIAAGMGDSMSFAQNLLDGKV